MENLIHSPFRPSVHIQLLRGILVSAVFNVRMGRAQPMESVADVAILSKISKKPTWIAEGQPVVHVLKAKRASSIEIVPGSDATATPRGASGVGISNFPSKPRNRISIVAVNAPLALLVCAAISIPIVRGLIIPRMLVVHQSIPLAYTIQGVTTEFKMGMRLM